MSTSLTVEYGFDRFGRNPKIPIGTPINTNNSIIITIPPSQNRIFVPKIIPAEQVRTVQTEVLNGSSIVIKTHWNSECWYFKTLPAAFNRVFRGQTPMLCNIAEEYFVTIGGGMIIDNYGNLLLIVGHEYIASLNSMRQKAIISNTVFKQPANLKVATFIKNTLLKHFIGVAEVEIVDTNEMVAVSPALNAPLRDGVRADIIDHIIANADKLFYQI